MSFISSLNGLAAKGATSPNPATLGVGPPPDMPGVPPAPTGMGAMNTGNGGNTKKAAGDEAILALRTFQGFAPNLMNDINAIVDQIKAACKVEKPGPAVGEAGPPGAAAVDAAPTEDSGGPGAA